MNSSQNALGFGVSAEKDLIIFKLKQLSYIYLNISSNAEIGHEDWKPGWRIDRYIA